MYDHPLFGPVAPEHGWVPAPRYVLRRHRILKALRHLPMGELLEIGCGAGVLSHELSRKGYGVTALELSPAARAIATQVNAQDPNVSVAEKEDAAWAGRFDYLLAFEVLEHIADDREALAQWVSWLKPGGHLLISVPAHMRKWSASDEFAGHVRRYEKQELAELVEASGMEVLRLESYGFPMSNAILPLAIWAHKRKLKGRRNEGDGRSELNLASGIDRGIESRLFPLQAYPPGSWVLWAFTLLQGMFLKTDLGTGYLLLARKR